MKKNWRKLVFGAWAGLLALSAGAGLILPEAKPGWVFSPDETIAFTLDPDTAALSSPLSMKVRDFYGVEHEVTGIREGGRIHVEALPPGYYRLILTPGGAGSIEQELAVIPTPPETVRDRANPFGVNFHFTRVSVEEAERELRMAQAIGLNWGRGVLFDWAETEPDFAVSQAKYQGLLDMLARHDMNYLGGIYFTPAWDSGAPRGSEYIVWSRTMPENTDRLEAFCRDIAAAAPFVQYWEVGNECDLEGMWKGRWRNFTARNQDGIVGDYVDFLKAAQRGFRTGNPESRILFNGIASLDHGSYPGFFRQALEQGAAPNFDIMNIHYKVSMDDTRKLLAQAGKADCPVWVTELGGYAVGTRTTDGDVEQIVQDIDMSVRQLADGAAHVFKYDLRNDWDSPNDIEANFGLIRRDFSPKPAYVAYATLIRMLADAKPLGELNVTLQSDRGWLKGFAFHSARLERNVNVLWLNAVKDATVTLRTPDTEVIHVDSMGTETKLEAVDGRVSFPAGQLPFYIIGTVEGNPGAIVYPEDQMTKSLHYLLNNPGFEERFTDNVTIPGWEYVTDPAYMTLKDSTGPHIGTRALHISLCDGVGIFTGVGQRINLIPFMINLGPDEFLKLKASVWVKREGLVGRGGVLSISFYDRDGKRLSWQEMVYEPGTHDWREETMTVERIPEGTCDIRLEYWFAPQVTGDCELDDFALDIQTWERPARR